MIRRAIIIGIGCIMLVLPAGLIRRRAGIDHPVPPTQVSSEVEPAAAGDLVTAPPPSSGYPILSRSGPTGPGHSSPDRLRAILISSREINEF